MNGGFAVLASSSLGRTDRLISQNSDDNPISPPLPPPKKKKKKKDANILRNCWSPLVLSFLSSSANANLKLWQKHVVVFVVVVVVVAIRNTLLMSVFPPLDRLYVFPRMAPVAYFPALGTGCMFSRPWTSCLFSRAWHRVLVFASSSYLIGSLRCLRQIAAVICLL